MPHRQARALPIAPGRPLDRPQHLRGPQPAQVPELVLEHALLDRNLRGRVQVLHLAAAAGAGMQAEVRASRRHALRAGLAQLGQHRLLPLPLAPRHVDPHPLTGQGTLDEDDLAVGAARNPVGVEVERLDAQPA